MYRFRQVCALFLLIFLLPHCGKKHEAATPATEDAAITSLVRDEEALLAVTPLAHRLALSLEKNQSLSAGAQGVFAPDAIIVDISASGAFTNKSQAGESCAWMLSDAGDGASPLSLWSSLFLDGGKISSASFGFLSGKHLSADTLATHLKFSANGRSANYHYAHTGKVLVHWQNKAGNWQIIRWETLGMTSSRRRNLMFRNATASLFAPGDHIAATRSPHEEKVLEFIQKDKTTVPKPSYGRYFRLDSSFQHPSVAIVDINQDGWDDMFVTSSWERCQLWMNQKGKAFTNQAREYGLDIQAVSSAAIFADLDNDGDQDLVLGRSLESSRIFWNNGGGFTPDPMELPRLVTSISAADANGDGLLDIYLCTYGITGAAAKLVPNWPEEHMSQVNAKKYREKNNRSHSYYNQAGPSNLLLINQGQRKFTPAPENSVLDQFRNTYQASWADFDKDGDQDLYICNDFAPDALLQNQGNDASGFPQFNDVSKEISGDNMRGFGMGASWGDYNNDQVPDLFVSNMHSKAGKRILTRFEGIDERLHFSAKGNLLFSQKDSRFYQQAGDGGSFPVHKGGWAFGGQFVDVDNDSWQDIYVLNGYYTAPKEIAYECDL